MTEDLELANIFAGRYIDGTQSYVQALYEAKKSGISKEDFDAAVFGWRVALGEVKRAGIDEKNGWRKPE